MNFACFAYPDKFRRAALLLSSAVPGCLAACWFNLCRR